MGDSERTEAERAPETDALDDRDPVAVALRSGGRTEGTRVIAKGHGATAEQILDIAFSEGVKVRTDAELVQMLDKVDVDSDIPLEALSAVAEILTYVYRLNAGAKQHREQE